MTAGILDPTLSSADANAGTPDHTTSASRHAPAAIQPRRIDSLDGLRIGLLENTKRNAAQLLDAVGAVFATEDHAELTRFTKKDFAMPLSEDMMARLTEECDAVVIGIGDCGSCSAAAVADGIALEARGIPAAVVCTEAFEVTSRAMARIKGHEDYDFLLMPHPIANLTAQDITDRGRVLASEVRGKLVGVVGAAA
ncbi:UGSC family (seleno)protein [Citricoccus sp. GCM10030269]|uniref:UGSC family (seleno)protein n=1 Tax=Citricoccus sp. GCM10030269 TaxID=3273388 RepID=UPI0036089488